MNLSAFGKCRGEMSRREAITDLNDKKARVRFVVFFVIESFGGISAIYHSANMLIRVGSLVPNLLPYRLARCVVLRCSVATKSLMIILEAN